MKTSDLIQVNGRAVSVVELRMAFNKVRDPDDWQAPIDALIPVAELAITKEAVSFFTGSNLKVVKETEDGEYLVRAVGCRVEAED